MSKQPVSPKYKLCPECDQPMLPPGVEKRPNEYDHASGCPLAPTAQAGAREPLPRVNGWPEDEPRPFWCTMGWREVEAAEQWYASVFTNPSGHDRNIHVTPTLSQQYKLLAAYAAPLAQQVEALRAAITDLMPFIEFYMEREFNSPSNHQDMVREKREQLNALRAALKAAQEAK